jgi:hypothetical protein
MLIRSLRLQPRDNQIALNYLQLAEQQLTDDAAGKKLFPNF